MPTSPILAAKIETTEIWDKVCTQLKDDIGTELFNSWIGPLQLGDAADDSVTLHAPTRFIKNWITQHYLSKIQEIWETIQPNSTVVTLVNTPFLLVESKKDADTPPPPKPGTVFDFQTRFNKKFTFDNFVVGKANALAYAAAQRVAESDEMSFNPVFLYGGVGLGKTHLMHAIAASLKERVPNRKVLYLSAEKFMYQFVRALRDKKIVTFKDRFRSVDVLMVDDIQFICGKDSTQEEFFHTFNALIEQSCQIVISADKSPSDLDDIGERLRSRLGCGLPVDIHPADYELRLGILHAKTLSCTRETGLEIPDSVLEFLAHKITSNIRELEGALNRITAHAILIKQPVTVESVQELLRDLLRTNTKAVTIEEIQKRVAEHFHIKMADMVSSRRAQSVARPRQIAMYLSKQLTLQSLPVIGRKFGGRDHTTVMHAVRRVETLIDQNQEIAEDIALLKGLLAR